MSEPAPVRGIVLGHAAMAAGMVDAVRQIAGVDEHALVALSNRGSSPQALADAIRAQLDARPAIIFTDLQSGSCGFAARLLCQGQGDLVVITGVNLPMLLHFVLHRDLPLVQLTPRLLAKGRAGICCVPAELEDHARRAVSGG